MAAPSTTKSTDTFTQGLGKVLQELGGLMQLPDADLDFIQKLQLVLATKIRQAVNPAFPTSQSAGDAAGQGSPGGIPSAAAGGAGGPGVMAGPPGAAGQGVSPLAQPPDPGELQRVLAGAGGGPQQ